MDWLLLIVVIVSIRLLIPHFFNRVSTLTDKTFNKIEKMLDE